METKKLNWKVLLRSLWSTKGDQKKTKTWSDIKIDTGAFSKVK